MDQVERTGLDGVKNLMPNLEVGSPTLDTSNQLVLLDSGRRALMDFNSRILRYDFRNSRYFERAA